jgi:CBS domain-containing protein
MGELAVRDAMSRTVYAVQDDTSLGTVARLFSHRHIGGAPVIDERGRPRGMVTQSDLLAPDRHRAEIAGRPVYYRLAADQLQAVLDQPGTSAGVVADVMSPCILVLDLDTPLLEAARTMVEQGVHRVLVNQGGRLVGILTTIDALRALVRMTREPRHLRAEASTEEE